MTGKIYLIMSCDKLKNFPHVFYFTLDNEVKRQKYMEEQFKLYGITFTKISMPLGFPEYLKEKILDVHSELASKRCLAYNYFLIYDRFQAHATVVVLLLQRLEYQDLATIRQLQILGSKRHIPENPW